MSKQHNGCDDADTNVNNANTNGGAPSGALTGSMVSFGAGYWIGNFVKRCHHIVAPSVHTRARILDAYGSMWCNVWGHSHPELVKTIQQQATQLCHASLFTVSHTPAVEFAAALTDAIDRCAHRRRVVRLGWVADDDRWGLVRGASLVVYPSRYEGFGLVPLDAMSVGTPVVATAAGAVPEVVGEGAFLVPVGDVDALAGAIASVLTDTMLRDRLIAAGRIRAASFDWGRTVDAIHDLYRHAVVQR